MNKYWNPEFEYALTAPSGKVYIVKLWNPAEESDPESHRLNTWEQCFFEHCTFDITLLEEASDATIPAPKTINEIGDELAESAS